MKTFDEMTIKEILTLKGKELINACEYYGVDMEQYNFKSNLAVIKAQKEKQNGFT